jgi:hypothetical protein
MPSSDHFQHELRCQLQHAAKRGARHIQVNSAELHMAVGGYPGPSQRMLLCCDVMKQEMGLGDEIISDVENGDGPSLMIRYCFPR